jgi:hypothetical protein
MNTSHRCGEDRDLKNQQRTYLWERLFTHSAVAPCRWRWRLMGAVDADATREEREVHDMLSRF